MDRDDLPSGMQSRRQVLRRLGAGAAAGALSLGGCLAEPPGGGGTATGTTVGSRGLSLASVAFDDGGSIPARYTCEGENESPPLTVEGVPNGTVSLALVVDDPDAPNGPYVHWLVWGLPPDVGTLPAGVPKTERVDSLDGARQGTNSGGSVGYTGPCPPTNDGAHTYRFDAYALEREVDLDAGARRPALEEALSAGVLAKTRLTGTFDR
jgi:hypothetical protein